MKTIEYSRYGVAIPDAECEIAARMFLTGPNADFSVSTENFITAVRTLIREDVIDHNQVRFIFNGEELLPDTNGRLKHWPAGFCDTACDLLARLCRPGKKAIPRPQTTPLQVSDFGTTPEKWQAPKKEDK